ncbi:MAG: glycoside hydrolase family 5 protein [Actinomycetota bacterium]|nr:glycoside hydrolase family 5 protein [Actinomycetota bacterium]
MPPQTTSGGSRDMTIKRVLAATMVALLGWAGAGIAAGGPQTAGAVGVAAPTAAAGGLPTIRVKNHALVDGTGQPVQLRGVNRAAFESRCVWDTTGIADGPVDQASVSAMLTWKINAVRLPINEDCWLGINGLPMSGTAAAYRAAVKAYVKLLRSNGLYVVPEVHMSAPGAQPSTMIDYLPDADHMPTLWTALAKAFKGDHGIVFDPINEVAMASWNDPHPDGASQWDCWLNGCNLDSIYPGGLRYAAAGLQSLVNAIRATGATQPIILGGLGYNADLSQLLSFLPADPKHQLVASAHVYSFAQGNGIDAMFTAQLEPISQQIPVILGELGERNCDSGTGAYTAHVLSLVDGEMANGSVFGVLEWTWNAKTAASTGWKCPTGPFGQGGPILIRDYNGTPTVMGSVFQNWIGSKP